MALLEACAAGLPMITSDFESATDVITDRVEGMIVTRENVEALSEAMECVQADEILRRSFASHAIKRSEQYSIQNHVERLLNA